MPVVGGQVQQVGVVLLGQEGAQESEGLGLVSGSALHDAPAPLRHCRSTRPRVKNATSPGVETVYTVYRTYRGIWGIVNRSLPRAGQGRHTPLRAGPGGCIHVSGARLL